MEDAVAQGTQAEAYSLPWGCKERDETPADVFSTYFTMIDPKRPWGGIFGCSIRQRVNPFHLNPITEHLQQAASLPQSKSSPS